MYFCAFSECNYKTLWPANLRRHAAVHEKAPAVGNGCSLCLYRTARHNNVVRHLRLVHGGKGFVVKPPKNTKVNKKSTQKPESFCKLEIELEPEPPLEQEDEQLLEEEEESPLEQMEGPPLEQEVEFRMLPEFDNDPDLEQVLEFGQESDLYQEVQLEESFCEVLPNPPKRMAPGVDIIIWPEARHQEAPFYKRRRSDSPAYTIVSNVKVACKKSKTDKRRS